MTKDNQLAYGEDGIKVRCSPKTIEYIKSKYLVDVQNATLMELEDMSNCGMLPKKELLEIKNIIKHDDIDYMPNVVYLDY